MLLAAEAIGLRWYDTRHPWNAHPVAAATNRSAPTGTFYLLRYVSTRSPKGIYGFEPGCQVRLVKTSEDRLTARVSDGRQEVEVDASMLTSSLDLAERARAEDQALQAAIVADRERQQRDYMASHRDIFIAHAQSVHAAELARVQGAAIGGALSSPLDLPAQPTDTAAPVVTGTPGATEQDALASDPRLPEIGSPVEYGEESVVVQFEFTLPRVRKKKRHRSATACLRPDSDWLNEGCLSPVGIP